MRNYKQLLIIAFFLPILSFSDNNSVYAGEVRGVTKDTIKIGSIVDLTGPAAWYGKQSSTASQTLFRHINDQGGILGRKIKMSIQDNSYSSTKTVAALKLLISRYEIFCLSDILGSTPMQAAFPLIKDEKIVTFPQLSLSSLMHEPLKRYVFTATTPASDQVFIAVDFILRDLNAKVPKLAMVYTDDEYGKDGLKGFLKAAEAYDLEVVARETYKRGAIDYSSQVVNLRRANPDYIFHSGVYSSFAAVLNEARKLGWSPLFFSDAASSTPKFLKLAGDAAKGGYVLTYIEMGDTRGMRKLKKITSKYVKDAVIDYMYVGGWTNTQILIEGLRRAGRDLTPDRLVTALESIRNFNTGGLIGPVSYSYNNHKGGGYAKVQKVNIEKNAFLTLTSWREPSVK